ncbi:MAG: hypothetical protein NZM07_10900 [Elioraea sp.]|nr:hypothetical protein [Elioraea sp.]
MTTVFVTHDLGVVAQLADEVAVLYVGPTVERAPMFDLSDRPRHPCTRALLRSPQSLRGPRPRRPPAFGGLVPSFAALPGECVFRRRRERAGAGLCDRDDSPETATAGGPPIVRCHRAALAAPSVSNRSLPCAR